MFRWAKEDSMMLQEYQSAYFHFFRLKMTQSIGLEKNANLFDFSYKYLSITWLPKKCQNSKQLYGFWQDKNFAKSYKFVTKTVAPKYFYFLSLNDKIKIQNISIKTAVHKCSKAGRKKRISFNENISSGCYYCSLFTWNIQVTHVNVYSRMCALLELVLRWC